MWASRIKAKASDLGILRGIGQTQLGDGQSPYNRHNSNNGGNRNGIGEEVNQKLSVNLS